MKTSLKTLIAFLPLLLFLSTAVIIASPNTQVSIQSDAFFPIGDVIIYNHAGASVTVNVPGPGTFSVDLPGRADYAVINGQRIDRNQKMQDVILASGFVVQVTMKGDQIVVTDQQIVNDQKKHQKH